ncbi:MAG: DUF4911 domain-containing protein [Pseudomonadota bacterium]
MESTKIYLTIDRKKIALLKFLLESYEGLALLRTIDPGSGRVVLMVGPGAERETAGLLAAIKDDLGLAPGLSDDFEKFLTVN